MVTLKWFGQACFEIKNGNTVVTDPHDGESVGLGAPDTEGDFVTISHDHYDHSSGRDMVSKPGARIIDGPEGGEVPDIKLKRFESYHDRAGGDARGENTIFTFEVDGFRICHLGDLGHMLGPADIDEIGPVDILLIPVGGKFTIDGTEAAKLTNRMDPRVVVPMHYDVEGLKVPISGPGDFVRALKGEYEIEERKTLDTDSLPEKRTVYVLDCLA